MKDSGEIRSPLICSIGIMAYNEEANIGRLLEALLGQQTSSCIIKEIVVVASGCVDDTAAVVRRLARQDPRIKLIVQPHREGKASAVNLFLRNTTSEIIVLESADTLPGPTTIESLVAPFADPNTGMTGGRPVPSNNQKTFMGFAVHLLWALHHQIALQQPKLGELIAFRRVFHRIPYDSAVDEASIEPLVRGQGYRLRYVPEAIVYNRGPATIRDFLKQRRRIHAGHIRMRREQGYVVSTMSGSRILLALVRDWRPDWRYVLWTPFVVALEAHGRILGWIDVRWRKRDHRIWDIAITTKADINP